MGDGIAFSEEDLRELRHSLRTPINQILGYSQLLIEEALECRAEGLIDDLKKVELASRRLVSIMDRGLSGECSKQVEECSPLEAPLEQEALAPERAEGRLLVVDDDPLNRDMLSRRLARSGYQVDLAQHGSEALEKLRASSYDTVLLDVMMPGLSGFDVLARVRGDRSPAELPIIMATAMSQSEDIVKALKGGANDYVTKPLDYQVVLARVATQVALKRARDRVEALAAELRKRNAFITKTFGRFLSDEVVATLIELPDGLRLGGERRKVTILMSDLRGFTAIARGLSPEKLVLLLNRFLGRMADVVLEYGGTVDEFQGDSVLAVFGAPVSREDDALRAAACAIAMQRALDKINQDHSEFPALEMGIALNTGEVIVGNIGSLKRMKYGMVGSHVNLTARIESYTIGGQVLISETTLKEAGSALTVNGEIAVRAKGFQELISAYNLVAVGKPYDLELPKRPEELLVLKGPLPICYAVLSGKRIGREMEEAAITKLSSLGAEIRATSPPETYANICLQMQGPGGPLPEIYAKVIDRPSGIKDRFFVRFTSVPPPVQEYFASLQEGS